LKERTTRRANFSGFGLKRQDNDLVVIGRFKLRMQLQVSGLARGETFTKAEADYLIDNGLATGRRP
jgi:hypothetical protein